MFAKKYGLLKIGKLSFFRMNLKLIHLKVTEDIIYIIELAQEMTLCIKV